MWVLELRCLGFCGNSFVMEPSETFPWALLLFFSFYILRQDLFCGEVGLELTVQHIWLQTHDNSSASTFGVLESDIFGLVLPGEVFCHRATSRVLWDFLCIVALIFLDSSVISTYKPTLCHISILLSSLSPSRGVHTSPQVWAVSSLSKCKSSTHFVIFPKFQGAFTQSWDQSARFLPLMLEKVSLGRNRCPHKFA